MQLFIADREGGRAPPGEMDNFEEVDAKELHLLSHAVNMVNLTNKINDPGTTSSCCAKFIN